MELGIVVNRLNAIMNKLIEDDSDGKISEKIKFYHGQVQTAVAEVLSNIVPYSRVAVIATESAFEVNGVELVNFLKQKNFKPISVLLPNDFRLDVEGICGMFNLAEDVRAVIVLDRVAYCAAYYYATIKNLPCVAVMNGLCERGILAKKIYIKNGDTLDEFIINADRHIIFSLDVEKAEDVSQAFAYSASSIVGLTDYRLYGVVTRETLFRLAYDLLRSAVLNTFAIIKDRSEIKEKLLVNCMLLEIADCITFGKLVTLSAPSVAEYIYSGRIGDHGGACLASACVIAETYLSCFSNEVNELSFAPEYAKRAESLSKKIGIQEEELHKNFKAQGNRFAARKAKIADEKQKLKEETAHSVRILNAAMETYFELGGKNDYDVDLLTEGIKLSGDLPFYINGMSLIREFGIVKEN